MHPSSFFLALLCGAATAHAAGLPAEPAAGTASTAASAAAAPPAVHPLTGRWRWTLPGKACTESLDYRADGTLQGRSGEEATQGRYSVSPMPSVPGFYRLTQTVVESNGKADCAGDLHAPDDAPLTRFIQFSPRQDQLIVCREASLKACFGPLQRLPG